jgi:hypothetical protein
VADYDMNLASLLARCDSFSRLVDMANTMAASFHHEIRKFDECWGQEGKDQFANQVVPLARTEQRQVEDVLSAPANVVLGLAEALGGQAREIAGTQQDAKGAIQQQSGSSQDGSRH